MSFMPGPAGLGSAWRTRTTAEVKGRLSAELTLNEIVSPGRTLQGSQ